MQSSDHDDRRGDDRDGTGGSPPAWIGRLGSVTRALRLADTVIELLADEVGCDTEFDAERGIVSSTDGRWTADLAPLARTAADVPAAGWPVVIQREINRWTRSAAASRRLAPAASGRSGTTLASPPIIRLTAGRAALGQRLRPAFASVFWEVVRDLGPHGLAVVDDGPAPVDAAAAGSWAQVADTTVARYRHRWARLPVRSGSGFVLSGPHVTALLYDPDRMVTEVGSAAGGPLIDATVITNSLMLVMVGQARSASPERSELIASLRRFTAGEIRLFEPFTVVSGYVQPHAHPSLNKDSSA